MGINDDKKITARDPLSPDAGEGVLNKVKSPRWLRLDWCIGKKQILSPRGLAG